MFSSIRHPAALPRRLRSAYHSRVPKRPISPQPSKHSARSQKAARISVCLTREFAGELIAAARAQGASVSWFAQRLILRGWREYKRDGRL